MTEPLSPSTASAASPPGNGSPSPHAARASVSTMGFFGVGAAAVGVKNAVFGSFLLLYYNQVLGLEAHLASIALAVALVVDAVSDPLVGAWSDHVRTRLGRRHPFMYASILPFSISVYFLLQPPAGLSSGDLFLYLLALSVLVRLSMTFFEVPRTALGPELTKDYEQRTALFGVSNVFGWVGTAAMVALSYGVLFPETEAYPGSTALLNPAGYASMAWIAAIAVFVATLVSTLGLQGQVGRLYTPPESRRLHFGEVLKEARETLSNRSWLMIFLSGIVFALFIGLHAGTEQFYNVYFWQWIPAQLKLIPLIQIVAVIAAGSMAGRIAKGKDKKRVAVALFAATVVIGPLPVGLRLLSEATGAPIFPANGTDALWWVILSHTLLMSALAVVGFILIGSMVADIVEQSQEATGRRSEGLLSAGPALAQKTVSAGGVLLTGFLLSAFGFDAKNPTVAMMQQPMHDLAVFHVILGVSLPVVSTILVSRYTITREGHEKRIAQLGYVEEDDASS
ncbi:MAG: MFS transporter [Myxococcota bacterium]